jgi:ribose transport system substrate-binding protein
MTRDPYLIKSVAHAAQLMAAFESPGEVLSQRELVKRTKLSRGIVYRLLYTLEHQGAVEKLGSNQYRLMYRRAGRHKWKIGYGTPGIDTLFTRQVTESLRLASERCEEIELLMLDHRYKTAVTLRDADQFIRERVDLVIEYQIDEQVAAMIGSKYRDANIPVIAVNNPHPGATYFGANNYTAGLIGGRYLGKWARRNWEGDVDQIVMMALARAGAIPKSRLTGMVHGIQEALGGGADSVPVIYLDGDGQFEASWRAIRKHLSGSGGRTLIGAMNDNSALGVLRAYDEAGRLDRCAVMGQNGSPEARQELRRSRTRLIGSVAYFPESYGDGLVRLALGILNRRFVPPAVFTHHRLLTPANVDHFYPNDALMRFPAEP